MTALQRWSRLMPWCASVVVMIHLSTARADLVRPLPWLAGVTGDSVYVCAEANDANSTVVEYGLTSAYGNHRATEYSEPTAYGNRVHNVKLTGLQPNAQYHYPCRARFLGQCGSHLLDSARTGHARTLGLCRR